MRTRVKLRGAIAVILASGALAACASALAPAPEAAAAKGYVIAEIAVTNPEPYKEYLAAVTPMVAAFGGTYLVRGGQSEAREGDAPKGRVVVIEFPSYAAAQAFNDSPEYAAIRHLRTDNAVSRLLIAEGTSP